MTKIIALSFAIILSGCATDPGGSIAVRESIIQKQLTENKILPLPGSCVSACTMQLIDPDVCVHPNAEIGFHAASDLITGVILPESSEFVFSYYRNYPKLQARLKKDRAMEKLAITYYYGRTLISYGVKKCPFNVRASSYYGG